MSFSNSLRRVAPLAAVALADNVIRSTRGAKTPCQV